MGALISSFPLGVCPKEQLPTYHVDFHSSSDLSKQLMPCPGDGPCMDHLRTSLLCVQPPLTIVEGTETSPNAPTAARSRNPHVLKPSSYMEEERTSAVCMGIPKEIRMLQVLPSSEWVAGVLGTKQWQLCPYRSPTRQLSLIHI